MRPNTGRAFDDMVEALEENEDMVECKECFDLFPKASGTKLKVGYICPTCKRNLNTDSMERCWTKVTKDSSAELPQFALTNNLFDQEFPEVDDYSPGAVRDYSRESTVGDALDVLIADEYDAIDGYEVADETIQHAPISSERKDKILDTLDHIKEEEEEHIDELKEVCPECDTKKPQGLTESEDEEIPEEVATEEVDEEDEDETEEVSDLEAAYQSALELANETGVGQVFGYARQETEEFVAIEPIEVDDPKAIEADLTAVYDDLAYAYVAYPEGNLSESLFESVQLNEAEVGILGRMANSIKHKAKAGFRKLTKADFNLDDIFTAGYYIAITGVPASDLMYNGKSLQNSKAANLADAEKLAASISKRVPKAGVFIRAIPKGVTIEDVQIKKIVDKYNWELARYKGGKAVNQRAVEEINKRLKQLELANQGIDDTTVGDTYDPDDEGTNSTEEVDTTAELKDAKAKAKKTLGEKKDPAPYTSESYKAYSEAFDLIVDAIDMADSLEELNKIDIATTLRHAEAMLKKKSSTPKNTPKSDPVGGDEEDEELEDETENPLEAARTEALDILGDKKDPEAYTEESYAQYSEKYDKYLGLIKKAKKLATFTDKYLPQLPGLVKKLNAILVELEDENLDDEEEPYP